MAIAFIEERKKQKKLLLVFGFLVALLALVLVQNLLRRILPTNIPSQTLIAFRKPEIDFTILGSQALKDLEPFGQIKPFEGKLGRENPFVHY